MNSSDAYLDEMIGGQILATARDVSNLVTHTDLVPVHDFLDLCFATLKVLPDHRRVTLRLNAEDQFGGPAQAARWPDLPPDLQGRWSAWRGQYRELVARNPRLELADRIDEVLRAIDGNHELDLLDGAMMIKGWVEFGGRTLEPWRAWSEDDRLADVFDALVRLRRVTHGWVIWDEAAEARVFIPDWAG